MRTQVRQALTGLSDDQLSSPVWFPLVGCGWVPAMVSAAFAVAHTWSEFTQLRYHMDQALPEPSPDAVHGAISFLQRADARVPGRRAGKGPSVHRRDGVHGAGRRLLDLPGRRWPLRSNRGARRQRQRRALTEPCHVRAHPSGQARSRHGDGESGLLKVQSVENMPRFGALFHPSALDQVIPAMGPGALG